MKTFKLLGLLSLCFLLSSCATLKEMICDCQPTTQSKSSSKDTRNEKKSSSVEVANETNTDRAEAMLSGEVYEAMDAFVFKGDEKRMVEFCKSPQVQCWVQSKKWPAKKKLDRKKLQKSPFMTGSKMGLRGDERIQIRWEFYKSK